MILIFKDDKLVGIEKGLLNELNVDLATLNNIISPIELNIHTLKNESINILSKNFKISEKPILSVENIKVFELIPQSFSNETITTETLETPKSLEEELFKETLLNLEQENKTDLINISPEKELQSIASAENEPIENKNTNLLNKEELIPKPKEEEITISFNDEYDEINQILTLDKEKAKDLINQDLQKASKDLGIDIETLNNLFKTLLDQIEENKPVFKEALQQRDYDKLHKTAHLLKGAALNLRLSNIALILKTIDEESKKGSPIEKIEFLVNQFYSFIEKIKEENKKENSNISISMPENIKQLIIQTIKNYLATQNEKKFKKDLKYIEKLLNVKINSVEELENLVKADR